MNPLRYTVIRLASCCALLAASMALAQSDTQFSSLEERMTGEEFNAAGLHKLSPRELAALNQWIRERSLAENERPSGAGLPSQPGEAPEIESMAREAFQSRIVGEFNGWSGNTTFELENGMVWRQTDNETFHVPGGIENPTVIFQPAFMGSWIMEVEGYNSKVRVERIK